MITNAPHFFDYLADTIPVLKWDVLFSGRDANGHAIEGSLLYWGYRLSIQLPLLWETFCVAMAATVVSALIASFLAFLPRIILTRQQGYVGRYALLSPSYAPCQNWHGP